MQIPLPFSIDYRGSSSVIVDAQAEPPTTSPLYVGGKEGNVVTGLQMLRENVKTVGMEG
jgi:hypothetical protein